MRHASTTVHQASAARQDAADIPVSLERSLRECAALWGDVDVDGTDEGRQRAAIASALQALVAMLGVDAATPEAALLRGLAFRLGDLGDNVRPTWEGAPPDLEQLEDPEATDLDGDRPASLPTYTAQPARR